MVQALKLKNHKGVRELRLTDLGHINILSGENNAGKTSILEAANEETKRSIGFFLKEKLFEEYVKIFRPLIRTSSPSPDEILNTLRSFIKKHDGAFLYLDEVENYSIEFNRLFKEIHRRNYGGDYEFGSFFKAFTEPMNRGLKTCLVDPKRKIESQAQINTSVKLSTDGSNLLNRLFFLKNDEPHSQGYEIYKNIYEAFMKITDGVQFNILPNEHNHILLRFKTQNTASWMNSEHCGLGLREILMILTLIYSPDNRFILIEEPENHLHPRLQRRLLEVMSEAENKQFLIASHSSIFLDTSYVNKIFWVSYNGQVAVEERTNKAKVLNDLGYSVLDNLTSDLVILTEGPKDFVVIEEFLRKMGLWDRYDIKFWPLGGDIMSQLDPAFLNENYNLIALVDSDPGSSKERERFKAKCAETDIECFQLKKYSIENYYTLTALRSVFGSQIPTEISEIKSDIKLEKQIRIDVKKCSRRIAQKMTLDDIKNTDLYGFLNKLREVLAVK